MDRVTHPSKPMQKRDMWGQYQVWPDPRAIALGRSLRRARLMAGLSQLQLSFRSGVSQSVISRFERGLAPGMTTERLMMLSDVLGVRMPLGFCPHDHQPCLWPRIEPVGYDHPPAEPRTFTLDIQKPKHRREGEIARGVMRAYAADPLRDPGAHSELLARVTREVDEERSRSA
jgi:transcriptional regulator with XRE-family HTH domain